MAIVVFSSSRSLVSLSSSPLCVSSRPAHSFESLALPSRSSSSLKYLPSPALFFSYLQNSQFVCRNPIVRISLPQNLSQDGYASSIHRQCNAPSPPLPHSAISPRASPSQAAKFSSRPLLLTSPLARVSFFGSSLWDVPFHRMQHKEGLMVQAAKVYSVEIEHKGKTHVLEVAEDETILSKALDAGLDVPYDCKLGVCMTCPAKLEQGQVDQSGGMLSEDVKEKGYALMCSSYPLSDCRIRSIPEDELLSLQLVTAAD